MADSSVNTGAAGAPIRVLTGLGTGVADQQVVTLGDSAGALLSTTTAGSKVPLDVNIAASAGALAVVTQAISTSTTPGNPNTASTSSGPVIAAATLGNVTAYLYGGTYTALTLAFEISFDGTNWAPILATRADNGYTALTHSFTAAPATAVAFEVAIPGVSYMRVRATALTETVAPSVTLVGGPFLYDPAPTALMPFTQTIPAASNSAALGATPPAAGGTFVAYLTGTAVQAAAALVNAPAAGLSLYVTDVMVGNSGAALTVISLLEGTMVTRYSFPAAVSGGGGPTNLKTPWKLPAATALGIANSVATTSWSATINGYVAP